MPESVVPPSSRTSRSTHQWPFTNFLLSLVIFLVPVVLGVIVYQLDSFDPGYYPDDVLTMITHREPITAPKRNNRMLRGAEKIGVGQLFGAEDIAYEPNSGVIYTGCVDGWIKRVTVNDSVVQNWINTGGRPLGLAHGHHCEVIVADADKGLLNVSSEGAMHLLTDEADGLKFKLTDAVAIAEDGNLYFTDASYKYTLKEFVWDFFEGRPYGRLLQYDPSSKRTTVLVTDLYFANGVAISPDQLFVIVCETPLRRCKKYYIQGERKGSVDMFVENLPGMPDNIRYDGEGHYWIALATELTYIWQLAQKYPFIRKIMAIMERYVGRPHVEKNSGVIAVDLEGKPVEHYYDSNLALISSGIKIGNHLYCGSIVYPYIIRLDLHQNPASPAAAAAAA